MIQDEFSWGEGAEELLRIGASQGDSFNPILSVSMGKVEPERATERKAGHMTIITEEITLKAGDRLRFLGSRVVTNAKPGAYATVTATGEEYVGVAWDHFANDLAGDQRDGNYFPFDFEKVETITVSDYDGFRALPAGARFRDIDGDLHVVNEFGGTDWHTPAGEHISRFNYPDEYLPFEILNPEILGEFTELAPEEEPLAEWELELLDWDEPVVYTVFEKGDKVRISDDPKCITAVDREGRVTDRYAGKEGVILGDDSDIFKLGNYVVKVEDDYFNTQFIAPEHLTLVPEPKLPPFAPGTRVKVIGNDPTNPAGLHSFTVGEVVTAQDPRGAYDSNEIVFVTRERWTLGECWGQWIKATDLTDVFPEYEVFGFEVGQEFNDPTLLDELPVGTVIYGTWDPADPSVKAHDGRWYHSPLESGMYVDVIASCIGGRDTAVIAYLP